LVPNVSAKAVVRDVLAEVDELQTSLVLRAAAKEIVRQIGKGKAKEHARRLAGAYIDSMALPLEGALVRRVALPAVDRFMDDALSELDGG
jgi:hypothetical protein